MEKLPKVIQIKNFDRLRKIGEGGNREAYVNTKTRTNSEDKLENIQEKRSKENIAVFKINKQEQTNFSLSPEERIEILKIAKSRFGDFLHLPRFVGEIQINSSKNYLLEVEKYLPNIYPSKDNSQSINLCFGYNLLESGFDFFMTLQNPKLTDFESKRFQERVFEIRKLLGINKETDSKYKPNALSKFLDKIQIYLTWDNCFLDFVGFDNLLLETSIKEKPQIILNSSAIKGQKINFNSLKESGNQFLISLENQLMGFQKDIQSLNSREIEKKDLDKLKLKILKDKIYFRSLLSFLGNYWILCFIAKKKPKFILSSKTFEQLKIVFDQIIK